MKRIGIVALFCATLLAAGPAALAADAAFAGNPAAAELERVFAAQAEAVSRMQPTGISRANYLGLIAGGVDFFKSSQRADGAIIDAIGKKEVQYSTPAFAAAAGLLVKEAGRKDLLEPASKALTCSLTALVAKKAADGHSDFYIPLIMQAYASLKDQVSADTRTQWEKQLQAVDPRTMYRAELRKMNWNLVSFSGETLRRRAGMVVPAQRDDQQKYLDESIAGHLDHLTKFGMYEDPNAPLAYDAFSRLWLEQVLAADAYQGPLAQRLQDWLHVGGLSSLLLLSPTGEWASGGRSAFHQWNEAELAVICEIEAVYWKQAKRPDIAGAFKRSAHLALASMQRWQRPSGEMWIVKNRAEPAERFGYETYSAHSQYNLLPMAMLAVAYAHADDTTSERPAPSEIGGYVFDLRETFHKIAAAAGGYYLLIDTAADPHYNATGLQRIQRVGVPFSPLSDSTAADRAYAPNQPPKLAMTPGIQWQQPDGKWLSLASFTGADRAAKQVVTDAALRVREATPQRVGFTIDYTLAGADGRHVIEQYTISDAGVEMHSSLTGDPLPLRVRLPALTSDGAAETQVSMGPGEARIVHAGSLLRWNLLGPLDAAPVRLDAVKTVSHQGYVQALLADVPPGVTEVAWRLTLEKK